MVDFLRYIFNYIKTYKILIHWSHMAKAKREKVEVRVRVPGVISDSLEGNLNILAQRAIDSCDMEEVLRNAINSFYVALPNGKQNYTGESRKLGYISLIRTHEQPFGFISVWFNPSTKYTGDCSPRPIATIDLRNKTYDPYFQVRAAESKEAAKTLMKDTDKVMKALGLRKKRRGR